MHQVYDDEMTFKLVAAASNVSGLPVEVCLEEFGKHFLVYCQKNGYDQILRVLGSNLYDFLTNLDNLHDHLASIYPGMRAPSFRVTRNINTNQHNANDSSTNNNNRWMQVDGTTGAEQQVSAGVRMLSDELHKQNASCSLAGSMYLHYYSERAGLSPIVKGLVMAVAKEFFQTDIMVTECKINQQQLELQGEHIDDHVVLKIDRRNPIETSTTRSVESGESSCSVAGAATVAVATERDPISPSLMPEEQARSRSTTCTSKPEPTAAGQVTNLNELASGEHSTGEGGQHTQAQQQQTRAQLMANETTTTTTQLSPDLNIYDSLSTNARDSLVNSEIMMQTFPFHVIFDREFNLVQVGKSLLRVTSLYWQRKLDDEQLQQRQQQQQQLVKFSDLFRIIRPKIEFTFDAIADHTNQVFVVKTRPLVLNADYRRLKRLSSGGSHSTTSSSSGGSVAAPSRCFMSSSSGISKPAAGESSSTLQQTKRSSMCPFDRMAFAMRRRSLPDEAETTTVDEAATYSVPAGDAALPAPQTGTGCGGFTKSGSGHTKNTEHLDLDNLTKTRTHAQREIIIETQTLEQRPSSSSSIAAAAAAAAALPVPHQFEPCNATCTDQQQQQLPVHENTANQLSTNGSAGNSPTQQSTGNGGSHQRHQSVVGGQANQSNQQQQQHQLDELGDPVNHLSLRLKGQMIILLGGELCLYLCSPRVDHLDQLMECGVKMSDFALHDRARELMLMSHTHKEDREAVKKLDQASNDLKKMDTKLRQENKRTNEVLHNIFPAKIAALLSHGLKVESESFDLVTCLYSDIIGFTKMCGSENVKPIDIVRLLNTMYLQFDNLTNIHGVFKVETIGDAYVVVGGLPEPVEDHADRCVKMGLDMVKVIGTVRSPADGLPIQMRIGIHSGPVMAGIVGIRVPRYSLFGNTTTLANQLETHGVGGKIHISDFTLKNLIKRDRFVVETNPNEISAIPFGTYFVTNYLGDQNETLKHEKILEEQLIKDFELMGNELELVDDSYQKIYGTGSSAARALIDSRSHQEEEEGYQTTTADREVDQDMALEPEEEEDQDMESAASTALPASSSGVDHLQAGAYTQEQATACNRHSGNQPRRAGRPPPLADTITNSDEEQYDRLILMDIEGNGKRQQKQQQQENKGRHLLRKVSSQLSASIISEAIKQVDWAQSEGCARLLALLMDKQTNDLELVLRNTNHRQQAATTSSDKQPTNLPNKPNKRRQNTADHQSDTCPLCDGVGLLDLHQNDLIHVKLTNSITKDRQQQHHLPLASSINGRQSCGRQPQPAGDANDCPSGLQADNSLGDAFTNNTGKGDAGTRLKTHSQVGRLFEWLSNQLNEMIGGGGASLLLSNEQQRHHSDKRNGSVPTLDDIEDDHCRRASSVPGDDERALSSSSLSAGSHSELAHPATRTGKKGEEEEHRVIIGSDRRRPSIEQLLAELRDERRKLAEQVDRLKRARADTHTTILSLSAASAEMSAAIRLHGNTSTAAAATTRFVGSGRVLSSNIQRIKRMDTLKRRKIKKLDEQHDDDDDDTVTMMRFNASPLSEATASTVVPKVVVDNVSSPSSLPVDEQQQQAKKSPSSRPIAEEEEEEGEVEVEVAEKRTNESNGNSSRHAVNKNRPGKEEVKLCDHNNNDKEEDSRHDNGGISKIHDDDNTTTIKQSVIDTRAPAKAQVVPPDGRRASELVAEATASQRRTSSSAYNYQTLRSSLAGIVNEVSQQSRKKRFNFNPFANLTFTSPFASPIKKPTPPAAAAAGQKQRVAQVLKPETATMTTTIQAQESFRSQSHSQSSGATSASPRPGRTNGTGSNCSCLKSSTSSQSVYSTHLK